MTKEHLALLAAVFALCGLLVIKCIDIVIERSRRTWDDRQKTRLAQVEAAADLLRAAMETIDEISSARRRASPRVKVDLHVAILRLKALDTNAEVTAFGEAVLNALARDATMKKVRVEVMRKLLPDFTDAVARHCLSVSSSGEAGRSRSAGRTEPAR